MQQLQDMLSYAVFILLILILRGNFQLSKIEKNID